jgi:hypothetical protein
LRAGDQDEDAGEAGGQAVVDCLDLDEEEGAFSSESPTGWICVFFRRCGEGVMKRKPSLTLDPRLAWALCQGLTQLSLFLWDCYEEDFLKLAKGEKVRQRQAWEEERELEIPF